MNNPWYWHYLVHCPKVTLGLIKKLLTPNPRDPFSTSLALPRKKVSGGLRTGQYMVVWLVIEWFGGVQICIGGYWSCFDPCVLGIAGPTKSGVSEAIRNPCDCQPESVALAMKNA